MKMQRRLLVAYVMIFAGILALAILAFLLKNANDRHVAAQDRRHRSILLADELRQSSDDLTRLVRTYVVTGDTRYEEMYWEVLDIRNGKKPRPEHYERVYWDLVLNHSRRPRPDEEAVPLRELQTRAGFTEAEFAKLAEAQSHSDGLVKTETIAMNMVKGVYADEHGHFTVKGQPDLETARRITHDEAYHKTKAAIMKPIAEFQEMLDARTEQEASQAFGRAQALFVVSQAILVGLVAATILLFELKKQQHEATALILAKYRGLFEHSRDALATLEPPSWAFTSANPATLEMFRANSRKDFFSRRLWEWSPEKQPDGRDSSEKAEEMIETAMRDGSHFFEWMHRRSDGEEFPADVLLARMREGEKVILQATVRDITDRKRTEEHLLRAQKMEAIGQLAGGVAHEIRNQLQVVLGYGEMLLRDSLVKEEGRAMLQEISKAARRSSTITGQLLAYSRRETLRPVVVSIRDCMAEIGKLLPHMIGEDIRMIIQSSTDECRATIDPHLFQQAILNLATNARDAMPKGGTLTIETGRVTLGPESRQIDPDLAEGPYVVVTISDTGSGMSKATLARVFDPFFTTKEVGKGTGLGLPMIQGFVKQSGGTVAIQSEPGRGTTVRLYFPPAAAAMVPAAEPGRQPALTLRGVGETLLLVEDEPAVRAVAVELLRTAGYRVLTAADAEEALPLAERYDGTINLLVTDIVMPGMTGVALAEQLRDRYPDLGVLYITGYPREELTRRGVSESVAALNKPFTAESLLEHVRHALDTRKTSP